MNGKLFDGGNTTTIALLWYNIVFDSRTTSIKRTQWKTLFDMTCKEGQFDVALNLTNLRRINLNAENVNGMTPYVCTVIRYPRV